METALRLLQVAELLEKWGVPSEKVSSEMAALLPYSIRYIEKLLPEKYKRKYRKIPNSVRFQPEALNLWVDVLVALHAPPTIISEFLLAAQTATEA